MYLFIIAYLCLYMYMYLYVYIHTYTFTGTFFFNCHVCVIELLSIFFTQIHQMDKRVSM